MKDGHGAALHGVRTAPLAPDTHRTWAARPSGERLGDGDAGVGAVTPPTPGPTVPVVETGTEGIMTDTDAALGEAITGSFLLAALIATLHAKGLLNAKEIGFIADTTLFMLEKSRADFSNPAPIDHARSRVGALLAHYSGVQSNPAPPGGVPPM